MNRAQLGNFPILLPPLRLQSDFVKKYTVIRSMQSHQAGCAAKVESVYLSLLRDAFSGRLTAKWRAVRMNDLLMQIAEQARLLQLPIPPLLESTR